MSSKQKKGITMTSLVVYIAIFSSITVLLSIIYTSMNKTLFFNRGKSINYTSFNKLQYNVNLSASESNSVVVNDNGMTYSNGDYYIYDSEKKALFLNGGVLCQNVESFNPTMTINGKARQVNIAVEFNKYLNELSGNIIFVVEEN